MTLLEELQANYYLVKEAVSKMHFERPADYELFLAAGFRTCWGVSWQKAGRSAQPASGQQSTPSTTGSSVTTDSAPNANITLPTAGLGCGQNPELPDASASGAGAQCFLAQLLRTRALTKSQYIALCKACAIPPDAWPTEQDVMRLDFKACVSVLCGDGGRA